MAARKRSTLRATSRAGRLHSLCQQLEATCEASQPELTDAEVASALQIVATSIVRRVIDQHKNAEVAAAANEARGRALRARCARKDR